MSLKFPKNIEDAIIDHFCSKTIAIAECNHIRACGECKLFDYDNNICLVGEENKINKTNAFIDSYLLKYKLDKLEL